MTIPIENQPWSGMYHDRFPEEWAEDHEEGTGPEECSNCAQSGCMNGVFVGYCSNCALWVYEGERGRGFVSPGVETEFDSVVDTLGYDDALLCESAFDTYLADNAAPIDDDDSLSIDQDDLDDYDIYGLNYMQQDNVFICDFEDGYNDF